MIENKKISSLPEDSLYFRDELFLLSGNSIQSILNGSIAVGFSFYKYIEGQSEYDYVLLKLIMLKIGINSFSQLNVQLNSSLLNSPRHFKNLMTYLTKMDHNYGSLIRTIPYCIISVLLSDTKNNNVKRELYTLGNLSEIYDFLEWERKEVEVSSDINLNNNN